MFEAVFLAGARAARARLSDEERADLDRVVRLIELNPWADDVTKFTLSLGRGTAGIYDDGR